MKSGLARCLGRYPGWLSRRSWPAGRVL